MADRGVPKLSESDLNSVVAEYCDLSVSDVSQINYLSQPSGSAKN